MHLVQRIIRHFFITLRPTSRLLKKVLLQVLIIWQKHTVNNYPTNIKTQSKVFFGLIKMVWLVQINVCNSSNPQSLRGWRVRSPGPPTRALPWTRWGTLRGPQIPLLLTPPLIPNPGSAPRILYNFSFSFVYFILRLRCPFIQSKENGGKDYTTFYLLNTL